MLASAMTKITLAIKTITHFIADGKNQNDIDNDTNKDNDIEVDVQQLRWLKANAYYLCIYKYEQEKVFTTECILQSLPPYLSTLKSSSSLLYKRDLQCQNDLLVRIFCSMNYAFEPVFGTICKSTTEIHLGYVHVIPYQNIH